MAVSRERTTRHAQPLYRRLRQGWPQLSDDTPAQATAIDCPSRRQTLAAIGASTLGLTGTAAATDDGFELLDSGPNSDPLVTADGDDLPADPDRELFDAEPEFPPFTMVEEFREDYPEEAVDRYLRPHGVGNLLASRRLVVQPDAEVDGPVTWETFAGASAQASLEPVDAEATAVDISFEGLYPEGVYTVWVVEAPGYHRPVDGNDGDANVFTAGPDGDGQLTVEDRPDELTLPPGAAGPERPITQRPLHELPGEFSFVLTYHYDNRTWDAQPGPFWGPQLVLDELATETEMA